MKLTGKAKALLSLSTAGLRRLFDRLSWKTMWQGIRRSWLNEWRRVSNRRFYIAVLASCTTIGCLSWLFVGHVRQTSAVDEVYTNGSAVGVVPHNDAIVQSMSRLAQAYDVHVVFVPVHLANSQIKNWKTVASLPTSAFAIEMNNTPLVYTENQQAAANVLSNVRNALTKVPLHAGAHVSFVGNVRIQRATIGVAQIVPQEIAVRELLYPADARPPASRSESLTDGLLLGQQLRRRSLAPIRSGHRTAQSLLHVKVSETVQQTARLRVPVRYVNTRTLGAGTVHILRKGMPGIARQRVNLDYIDGRLVARHVVHEMVLVPSRPELAERGTNTGTASGAWGWPTTSYTITSGFGSRVLDGMFQFHPGVDIGCSVGTPVFATNDGVVEEAGWNSGGYGIWVRISNGNGIETVFGHLSRTTVHPGEIIAKGQLIAYSGDTGMVTGPHLHYEVRRLGTAVSPTPYM